MLFSKIADPRIDPGRTSITRVEVPEDLLTARVYISVMGTDAQTRKTLRGLQDSAGRLQDLISREVRLRHTPKLLFEVDERFKKTLETLDVIERAMDEIRQKEQAHQADEADDEDSPGPDDPDE